MRAPILARVLLPFALVAGCGDDAKDPGPPQLTKFLLQVPHEMDVDLLAPPDGGITAVSGAAAIRLVFNELLDGSKIETITAGQPPMPKTDVVSITWLNAPAGAPAILAPTSYDPSGAASVTVPAPKINIHPTPGLPSGAQLQVKLDRTKITNKNGGQFVGADTHMVTTQPFAASANVMPDGVAGADLHLAVTFTNVPAMNAAQQITLTSNGMPVMTEVAADPSDPRILNVTPMMWVAGQSYTLSVSKDVADLFGIKLPEALSVRFTIRDPNNEAGAPDGGGGTDGGAPTDGGVADGAADMAASPDGGAPDGGAPDTAAADASSSADAEGGG